MRDKIIITIDGTSSTGKSTIAKRIAKKLDYIYIDSGAMYRALTYYAITNNLMSKIFFKKTSLINDLSKIKIDFRKSYSNNNLEVNLNGISVENKIRSLEVSDLVSQLAAIDEVRTFMVKIQHSLGKNKGVVMDGRDIGTVVFPEAELKFYLEASAELRSERRFEELKETDENISFNEVYNNINLRDTQDINRSNSPLKKASDAILIDTEKLTLDEVENKISYYISTTLSNS
ncbi:MAG: (d)CMP kinase [Flavobacteriaceae bacterium]|jgi:cytidylate kinase|nr:(d)CMP kinase [Flavobacteriaceae bacterium]MBT3794658.1 (d)CMP kinase [Flavobacteriaceae bacterium]MBT4063515.1 (d)CMP kinase [Flavobacteriaceae bacterium]MBT4246778.1 (d)CMP kinase [Flavobacteriaceae bacterium]MBT4416386.1 (d)CMP kinase [Flavobacteriaceae bacterium]